MRIGSYEYANEADDDHDDDDDDNDVPKPAQSLGTPVPRQKIKRELKQACKTKEHSVFKDKSLEALEKFNCCNMVANLQRTAPILTTMLQNCINVVSKDISQLV